MKLCVPIKNGLNRQIHIVWIISLMTNGKLLISSDAFCGVLFLNHVLKLLFAIIWNYTATQRT